MIHRIKYSLLLLTYPFLLLPQVVDEFEITGNNNFKNNEIIGWTQVWKGTRLYKGILDTIKSRVAFNLSLKGYFNPSFDGTAMEFSEDSQKVNIKLVAYEGTPTFIKKVIFTSNDSLRLQSFLPAFNFLEGQVFNKNELEEYINDALTKLENDGHPFAVFTITSVYFYYDSTDENNYADLYLNLDTGIKGRL
jgi:outer membrane protein assembly factor BamA